MGLVTKKFIRETKQLLPEYAKKYKKNDTTLVSQISQCITDRNDKTFGADFDTPNQVLDHYFTKGAFISIEPVKYNANQKSFYGAWSAKDYTPNIKVPDTRGTLYNDNENITYDPKKIEEIQANREKSSDSLL